MQWVALDKLCIDEHAVSLDSRSVYFRNWHSILEDSFDHPKTLGLRYSHLRERPNLTKMSGSLKMTERSRTDRARTSPGLGRSLFPTWEKRTRESTSRFDSHRVTEKLISLAS